MRATFTSIALLFLGVLPVFSQGDTLYQSFVHDDSLRNYILYVPADYDGSEAWPLVINMHGFAWDAAGHMAFSSMNPVADTAHFIVAYPQGLTMVASIPGFPPPSPGFNLLADSLFVSPDDVDDIGYISRMLDLISADFQIASDQVYACGFSNGGMFSHILACEMEDRIAAIAAVGASMPTTFTCDASRPVPVLQINGTADNLDYDLGLPGLLNSIPGTLDFWTARNSCEASPVLTSLPDFVTSDSSTVERQEWLNCEAEVGHFKIYDGGHQWPGGTNLVPFLGHFNLDINASAEIWNFFQRNPHPNPPGRLTTETLIHDDSLRSFLLYVPAAYDGSEDWPLVINMHGFAWDAPGHMVFSNMNAVADTANFIIAYPQGLTMVASIPGFPPPSPGFNLLADSMFVSPDNVDDIGFIERLLDTVSVQYSIAQDRVYACGFSNGGMFSHILACEMEDRIAAIAAVGASQPVTIACDAARSVPVLQINGTADNLDYNLGLPGLLKSIPATLEFWANRNGCDPSPVPVNWPDLTTEDNSTVQYQQWINCESEVAHFKVFNGGHQWPGGVNLLPFLGPFNLDLNASAEIWNFFNRNPLNNPVSLEGTPTTADFTFRAYPNPFSDELTLEFELPRSQALQLRLVNVLGQVVGGGQFMELPAGQHRLPLSVDKHRLASGVYYVQLVLDGHVWTKPVVYRPAN